MFGIGYGLQAVVKLISSISQVFKQPKSMIKALVHTHNFQLGAFLASFVGLYRVGIYCYILVKCWTLHGIKVSQNSQV